MTALAVPSFSTAAGLDPAVRAAVAGSLPKLEITVQAYGTADELCSNIRSALARGLPEFSCSPVKHDGRLAIVGSGWSMPDYIELIRSHRAKGQPIIAVKAAHDFLVERGIDPDLWVNLDPRDRTDGIQRLNDRTIYMPASRCTPSTFDYLKGRRVLLWHSWAPGPEVDAIGPGKLAVGGGTTSGLRAINIAYLMGFRHVTLYGFDSCNNDKGEKRFTDAMTGAAIDVYVGGTGKRFTCNMAMAQQANEFQELFNVMPDLHVEAVGPGLIAAILEERLNRRTESKNVISK